VQSRRGPPNPKQPPLPQPRSLAGADATRGTVDDTPSARQRKRRRRRRKPSGP
jgi:hypothetical protein